MTSRKGSDLAPRAEPTAAETLAREIVALPTERLRQELAEVLRLTAANLVRLALIVKTLEERGEDLSDLRIGLLSFVRLIAYGRLAPEAVVAFAGRPLLLRALAGLPLDRQRALVEGETVAVIDPADPAQVQRIALMNLPNAAIRLVFGEGELRSPEAQRLALRPRRPRREDDKAAYRYRPRYDPASGTVSVGRMTVRLADVLTALASSAGPEDRKSTRLNSSH